MKTLEWNVVYFSWNKKDFVIYNVLSPYFVDEIKKCTKKIEDKNEFAEEVKRICIYCFWSKFEWEIILKEWTAGDNPKQKKIDVYDQLKLNWNRFIDYLWDNLRG